MGLKITEKMVENEILSWLAIRNIFAFKIKSQGTFDQEIGKFRRPSKYYKRGTADILGIFKGKPLAIEVKSEKGRLSVHQKIFLSEFEKHGGIAIVARSIGDVERGLREGLLAITEPKQAKSS